MDTWMKYTLGLVAPAFVFLVVYDGAQDLYGDPRSSSLSYVVAEPEPEAPVEEAEPVPVAVQAETVPADPIDPEPETVDAAVPEAAEEDVALPQSEAMLAGFSADDLAAGESAAKACASCHQFDRARNGAGPHLVDVIGRPVGAVDGFRYSDALQSLNADGAVWSVEAIQEWLADPSGYAPGTKMNFVVRDAEDRRTIAGWLAFRD